MGVRGEYATEVGKTARKIVERAAWVDLVALSLTRKKRNKAATGFGTGFQKIIQRSPRPILVVPENANSSFERALLAYDGSPKADEALYLAAYLANHWRLSLAVLSAGKESANMALERARDYLTKRRVEVEYIAKERPAVNAILSTASDLESDLIIMGGFGYRPLFQIFVGSTVLNVLKSFDQPVLICR
jgi:nucleotide-binding universal stress UspA family protein